TQGRGSKYLRFSADGGWLAMLSFDGTVSAWDGRPLTPDLQIEREAVALLTYLAKKPLLRSEMTAAVRTEPTISHGVRRKGSNLMDDYADDSIRLNRACWSVVSWPGRPKPRYDSALVGAMEATRREPANADFLTTLGVAYFRLGKYAKALD